MFDGPAQQQMASAYDALESARETVVVATRRLLRSIAVGTPVPDLADVAGGLHDLDVRILDLDEALAEGAAVWALGEQREASTLEGLLRITDDARAMTALAEQLGRRIPIGAPYAAGEILGPGSADRAARERRARRAG